MLIQELYVGLKTFHEPRSEPVNQLCVPVCLSVCQMTSQEVRLCGLLLQEHFGEVVEKVGTHMLRGGAQNLRTIIHETGISLDLVPFLSHLYLTPWK